MCSVNKSLACDPVGEWRKRHKHIHKPEQRDARQCQIAENSRLFLSKPVNQLTDSQQDAHHDRHGEQRPREIADVVVLIYQHPDFSDQIRVRE